MTAGSELPTAPGAKHTCPDGLSRIAVDGAHCRHWTRWAFVVFYVLWMGMILHAWTCYPGLQHGDHWSDANVLNAGRNFDHWGIGLNYGLPTLFGSYSPERPVLPYTHYPPGPEWLHQLWKTLGLKQLAQLRAVSIAFSSLAALLLAGVMLRLTGSRIAGLLAAFCYMWSKPFSQFADSLHEHAYMQATLFGVLAAWLAYERAETLRLRRAWLALTAGCFVLDMYLTMEHILLLPLFALGHSIFTRRLRRCWRAVLLMLILPPIVLSARVMHNALALGGIKPAIADMLHAAEERGVAGTAKLPVLAWARSWHVRLSPDQSTRDEHDSEFAYPLLSCPVILGGAVLAAVLAYTWRRPALAPARHGVGNALLLFLCGLAWFVAVRGHIFHRHLIMELLPGLALLLGSLIAAGFLQLDANWPRGASLRWLGPLAGLVTLLGFASDMRYSQVVNLTVPVHPEIAGIMQRRCAEQAGLAAGATGLQDTARVHVVWWTPEVAYLLDHTFSGQPNELPESLEPDEAVWLIAWSPEQIALARAAYARWGFPDQFSPPVARAFVFRGKRLPGEPADVIFPPALHLTRVRTAPSLDAQSWVLELAFDPFASGAPPSDLVVFIHALDSEGRVVGNYDIPLSAGIWDDQGGLVWQVIPRMALPAGGLFRIGVWNPVVGQRLSPDPNHQALPPQMGWDASEQAWLWNPRFASQPAPRCTDLGPMGSRFPGSRSAAPKDPTRTSRMPPRTDRELAWSRSPRA